MRGKKIEFLSAETAGICDWVDCIWCRTVPPEARAEAPGITKTADEFRRREWQAFSNTSDEPERESTGAWASPRATTAVTIYELRNHKGSYDAKNENDMNVLYVGLARTIWLFDFAALNPTGLSLRGAMGELAKRYQFAKCPVNELDVDDKNSLPFKSGTFVGERKVPIVVSLNIYADGWVADTTSSTDESSEFLQDLGGWLEDNYKLTVPKERRVAYLSQIDFQSDMSLTNLNRHLEPFTDNLDALARNKEMHYEVGSIQFWTEDISKPGTAAPVKIERKISAAYSANHYFSQAPLQTKAHLELIKQFEAILKAR